EAAGPAQVVGVVFRHHPVAGAGAGVVGTAPPVALRRGVALVAPVGRLAEGREAALRRNEAHARAAAAAPVVGEEESETAILATELAHDDPVGDATAQPPWRSLPTNSSVTGSSGSASAIMIEKWSWPGTMRACTSAAPAALQRSASSVLWRWYSGPSFSPTSASQDPCRGGGSRIGL